jgi:hypothetical protein
VEIIPSFVRMGKGVFNFLSKPLRPPLAKGRITHFTTLFLLWNKSIVIADIFQEE